ncbi:hypothetical protein V1264_012750 [Littorina saxatilis]|uniref:Ribosome biogenesis regulatory protein n=2 Tax=Littorina saxatilis TaxID=31220 RepID=A0AAN9BXW4_9CAEN
MQVLVNRLSGLPSESTEGVTVIKLPEPTLRLPREKPIPKAKPQTKWEAYAQLKGIQKKKKGRMLWDNESKQYKPRWGYGRKDETKSWLLEVPENADPNEDQFAKKIAEKKERVAKNELKRLRNIARVTKAKVPGVGLTPTDKPSKDHLGKTLAVTHKSTASLGKFMDTLPKEKLRLGKKRKFESNYTDDRERQKKILKGIADGTPVLDVNRAANIAKHREERERSMAKKSGDGEKKKAGAKGKKGGKKSFSGKPSGKPKKTFAGKTKKSFSGKKGGGGGGAKKGRK